MHGVAFGLKLAFGFQRGGEYYGFFVDACGACCARVFAAVSGIQHDNGFAVGFGVAAWLGFGGGRLNGLRRRGGWLRALGLLLSAVEQVHQRVVADGGCGGFVGGRAWRGGFRRRGFAGGGRGGDGFVAQIDLQSVFQAA